MRKDEIEDRIVRLEEEVRALKADHRDGVDTILAEVQKTRSEAIDDRIADLRERVVAGYQKIFLDLMLKNAGQHFEAQFAEPCARDRRKECCAFLSARLRAAAQQYQDPELRLPRTRETISDKALVKKAPFLADEPCSSCFSLYLEEKEQIRSAVEQFRIDSEDLPGHKRRLFVSELPDDLVVSTLVEPLSHNQRFAMLKALSKGSMTFSELSSLTKSKGGHLLYHITKLVEAGLVYKTDGGKQYAITDRGLGVMDLIRNLYDQGARKG